MLGFRMPKEEKDALFARAKAEGVSPSALLRRIIRKLVLSPPPPMPTPHTPDPGDEQPEA